MKLMIINSVFVLLSISCSDKKTVGEKKSAGEPKPFSATDAKADFEKRNYRMITYGFPAVDEVYLAQDSLAKIYGFYYDNQGCDVYDSSFIGADAYNSEMAVLLQKKNGQFWKQDFDWKIDSIKHIADLKLRKEIELQKDSH
jgi:hypothetical protein